MSYESDLRVMSIKAAWIADNSAYIRRSKKMIFDINDAGYGIRTRELLRDGILSPAPLASLANPALKSAWPLPASKIRMRTEH